MSRNSYTPLSAVQDTTQLRLPSAGRFTVWGNTQRNKTECTRRWLESQEEPKIYLGIEQINTDIIPFGSTYICRMIFKDIRFYYSFPLHGNF